MNFTKTARWALVASSMVASLNAAADPAVVFDMGGKFDKSFNEAAFRGMEKWKKDTGRNYLSFEISNESQREQALRRMAEKGANPIIGIGFGQASSIEKIAKEFPKLKFAIIDMVVNQPNVQSVVFKEQEGSFLVGVMAAIASKSGKVGFVGGMDIPLIRKFQCGYEQGAKYANPKAEVFSNMTGTTGAAWNDPARGGELAKAQFAKGALEQSARSLRRAASLAPNDAAVANNLASVELARGCVDAARQILDKIEPSKLAGDISAAVQATRQELASAGADHCPR